MSVRVLRGGVATPSCRATVAADHAAQRVPHRHGALKHCEFDAPEHRRLPGRQGAVRLFPPSKDCASLACAELMTHRCLVPPMSSQELVNEVKAQ